MIPARPKFEKRELEFSLLQRYLHEDGTGKDSPSNLGEPVNPLLWSNIRNPTSPDSRSTKLTVMLLSTKFEYFPKNITSNYQSPYLFSGKEQLFG